MKRHTSMTPEEWRRATIARKRGLLKTRLTALFRLTGPMAALLLSAPFPLFGAAQGEKPAPVQLPPELQGAKIYHFPEKTEPGKPPENPVIYKSIAYQSIQSDRLLLDLYVSIKPTDRSATVEKIYFQNVQVGGVPVHIETFDKEFKVSKKDVVDLPAPFQCAVIFTDLESLEPLKQFVDDKKIKLTGESFIEVKLNSLQKLAVGGKKVVLPVQLNEEIPMEFLPDSPFMQMAAKKVLETLTDPTATAAVAFAKEHVARLAEEHNLSALGQSSLYLIACQYSLRDPKSNTTEIFVQSGTGFIVSADGKLLTAKRVVQPWKFDPQIAFIMKHSHLALDDASYKVWAWPAGAHVLSPDGQLDAQTARSTNQQTLKLLKTAPDQMKKEDYHDPDSGVEASIDLHEPGNNDVALLQLTGTGFVPLSLVQPGATPAPDQPSVLLSFPYGLSQPLAVPKLTFVKATAPGATLSLDQPLTTGESGAPLLSPDGKVLALAADTHECVPVQAFQELIQ